MPGRILVVGSLNMDLVVSAPRHPQVGETILGGKFSTYPGGKGANQMVAAARMGAMVKMLGRVGRDGFGDELLASAVRDGIDISLVRMDEDEATGIALITVDIEGRNTIVVASGANLNLTRDDILASKEAFAQANVMVTQLENPVETINEAISLAAENRLQVVLNPAPAQLLEADLLPKVDYLIPNEREALQVAGAGTLEEAIERMVWRGARNLIITMGEKGILFVNPNGRKKIPAYSVKAIDTVAAGDAFVGAFSAGLAEGMNAEDAIRLGNAAAAISVTRHGAQPSLPTRKEVDLFLDANPLQNS